MIRPVSLSLSASASTPSRYAGNWRTVKKEEDKEKENGVRKEEKEEEEEEEEEKQIYIHHLQVQHIVALLCKVKDICYQDGVYICTSNNVEYISLGLPCDTHYLNGMLENMAGRDRGQEKRMYCSLIVKTAVSL